ncbi:MAG: phosphatidate cytidylyltransferase [Burkholderiaceae bacterium]|jgi:phosphatidate cytidylyltransferase|nr:phosphatidate cytidylyltransferase [Burkholderiaceae bacterium]
MLQQRLLTATVLLVIVFASLSAASPTWFIALGLLALAAAAWEWARLCGLRASASLGLGLGMALACLASWLAGWVQRPWQPLWPLAAVAWLLLGGALLWAGVARWPQLPRALRLALGLLALWVAWLALAHSRMLGVNYLLSAMALVWVADSAAYFSGRALGGRLIGRKLAASISPNKSWEGAAGGVLGVALLALLWHATDRFWGAPSGWSASLYTRLLAQGGWAYTGACALALVVLSVMGDLLESLAKRAAGVKDSSQLLPGHGGVLDRVDALLPALPAALALAQWTGAA